MIYFLVGHDGNHCKIGTSIGTKSRVQSQVNVSTMEFFAAIDGSGTNEDQIHQHFDALRYNGKKEVFRLEGELRDYLEWLGTRAFVATDLDHLQDAYPHPVRFPWHPWRESHAGLSDNAQQMLTLPMECLVPGLRKPLTRSARVLATIRSDSDEWYTPPAYTAAAREVMGGIDLDPASCPLANLSVGADNIYTRNEDGLRYEWRGRVWLNPPYGNEKDRFVNHLLAEYEAGRVAEAVMCLNAHAVDTVWFQPLWQFPCCFTHHRVMFIGGTKNKSVEETAPTTGTVFIYVGPSRELFTKIFSQFGPVVVGVAPASISTEEFRQRQRADFGWVS